MKMTILKSTTIVTIFCSLLMSCGGTTGTVYDDMFSHVGKTEQYEIMELAEMDERLSTFVELMKQSGLDLSMEFPEKPVTLFIPTNEAFGDMNKERFEYLKDPRNRTQLRRVLMRHILPTEVPSMQFNSTQILETAVGEEVEISTNMDGNVVTIGGANMVKSDIPAANGMIHIVDAVIQPTSDVVPQ